MTSAADDPTLERLRSAPLHPLGRFSVASNATLLCRVLDPGQQPPTIEEPVDLDGEDPDRLVVYKPQSGESPLWDFPQGTLWAREVAAYEVDRALGWMMVPATVGREQAPFGPGSVQQFVAHDPARHYFTLVEEDAPEILAQLRRMVVFDLVINNADRKGGHVLVDDDGRLRLVDHGVCFHAEPKLRTVGWHFAGDPAPRAEQEDVGRLAACLRDRDDRVRRRLSQLLSEAEVEALANRAEAVARLERLPEPEGPRPLPWPLL